MTFWDLGKWLLWRQYKSLTTKSVKGGCMTSFKNDPVLSSVSKLPQNCFWQLFSKILILYISNQFEYFFFSTLERPVLVLVVGVGEPRVDDLVVVVHPLEVGLGALDGLLYFAFGGAQAILVISLEPFQLKWMKFTIEFVYNSKLSP